MARRSSDTDVTVLAFRRSLSLSLSLRALSALYNRFCTIENVLGTLDAKTMGESMAVEFARERLGICTVEKDYLCTRDE